MIKQTCTALILFGFINTSYGTDFNDGIVAAEKIDDVIKKDINERFISQRILGQINAGNRNVISSGGRDAGIGNIIIGPNADLDGAIIINNSDNQGATAIAR